MKTLFNISAKLRSEKGVTLVYVALLLVVFLGITALAVDIGYLMVSRNELQNSADASALAATRKLGSIYEPMSYTAQQTYVCDPGVIIPIAQTTASSNTAAGQSVTVLSADVVIGTWDPATKVLTQTLNQPDAVRVTTRRDNTVGGPVGTFFARIFNINNVSVTATATAALTGQSTVGPGGLPIPVGISKAWFTSKPQFCGQPIKFYPTNSPDGCAGWNVYDENKVNASNLRKILNGLEKGTYTSPAATAGSTVFEFIGGTISSAFPDMETLFNTMKVKNDGIIDADNDSSTWTTTVVVYDWPDCSNPNKPIKIIGFATVVIRQVLTAPNKEIVGDVICENVEPGRGSGGNFGTFGSIPGLVQ
jgi:Flp pilus assembly protein TadG